MGARRRKEVEEDQSPFAKASKRAKEALGHRARYTFMAPVDVLHLIECSREAQRLRALIERHKAAPAWCREHGDADRLLWDEALREGAFEERAA